VTRSVVVTNRGAPRRPASNVRKRKRRAARRVGVVRRESATRLTPAPAGDAGARRLATPTAVRRDGLPRAAGDARVCQTAEAGSPVSGSLRRRSCSGRSSRSTTGVAQEVAPRVLGRVRRRTGVGTSRSCGSPPSGTGSARTAFRWSWRVGPSASRDSEAGGASCGAVAGGAGGRDDDPGPGRSARSPSRPLNLMVFAPVRADALP
jgi:hypothetical protein